MILRRYKYCDCVQLVADCIECVHYAAAEHDAIVPILIRYKTAYYYPDYLNRRIVNYWVVPDAVYDSLEKHYLNLIGFLGWRNQFVHDRESSGMMEVDFSNNAVMASLAGLLKRGK